MTDRAERRPPVAAVTAPKLASAWGWSQYGQYGYNPWLAPTHTFPPAQPQKPKFNKTVTCFYCNEKGHPTRVCARRQQQTSLQQKDRSSGSDSKQLLEKAVVVVEVVVAGAVAVVVVTQAFESRGQPRWQRHASSRCLQRGARRRTPLVTPMWWRLRI